MPEPKVTPESLNETLRQFTPTELSAFRANVDPLLFDELYRAGLSTHTQPLFLSEPQWGLLLAGMTKLVVLAFLIERALGYVFDHHWFLALEEAVRLRPCAVTASREAGAATPEEREGAAGTVKFRRGYKATLAFLVAWGLTNAFDFNIFAALFPNDHVLGYAGILLTALVVAGGSQGALALMQSVLGVRGSVIRARHEAAEVEARKRAASARSPAAMEDKSERLRTIRRTFKRLLGDSARSKKDLAVALGVTEVEIAKMASGEREISAGELRTIARFYGKDPTTTFGL